MTTARSPVAFFLPTLDFGGVERITFNLVQTLVAEGHAVDLVVADARGEASASIPTGVRLVDLHAPRAVRSLVPLARYLRRERPVALIAAKDHANVVAVLAGALSRGGVPVIATVHSRPTEMLGTPERWTGHVVRPLVPHVYARAAAVVAVSDGVADDVRAIAPRARVVTILNPVITPELAASAQSAPPHPWLGRGRSTPVAVWCGRLTDNKDPDLALDVVARVQSEQRVRLLFVGDGPLRVELERRITTGASEYAEVVGYVADPTRYLAHADVLLFTSTGREGLPTVIVEALALGVEVVATDCEAGPRQILADGRDGHLVPVGDVDALAGALLDALRGPRRAAPDSALEPFRVDRATANYLALIEEVRRR